MTQAHTPSHPECVSTPQFVLGIDPSISNLGYCLLQGTGPSAGDVEIVRAGIIRQTTSRKVDYHARGVYMTESMRRLIAICDPKYPVDVLIETPTNWFNTRGQASKDDEAVQKLYYQCGLLIASLMYVPGIKSVSCVGPNQWKGQAPKDVMKARARRFAASCSVALPEHTPHDTCEAILLARYGHSLRSTSGSTEPFNDPIVLLHDTHNVGGSQSEFTHEDFIDDPD